MRYIHNVEQQVRFAHFVQCAFEAFDKLRGQFADETDGIREQKGQIVQYYFADCRIKRGEEFVLSEHFALGNAVHQR